MKTNLQKVKMLTM